MSPRGGRGRQVLANLESFTSRASLRIMLPLHTGTIIGLVEPWEAGSGKCDQREFRRSPGRWPGQRSRGPHTPFD